MNILEIGIESGIEQGTAKQLMESVGNVMTNLKVSVEEACAILGTSVEAYENARTIILKKQ